MYHFCCHDLQLRWGGFRFRRSRRSDPGNPLSGQRFLVFFEWLVFFIAIPLNFIFYCQSTPFMVFHDSITELCGFFFYKLYKVLHGDLLGLEDPLDSEHHPHLLGLSNLPEVVVPHTFPPPNTSCVSTRQIDYSTTYTKQGSISSFSSGKAFPPFSLHHVEKLIIRKFS